MVQNVGYGYFYFYKKKNIKTKFYIKKLFEPQKWILKNKSVKELKNIKKVQNKCPKNNSK